MGLLIVGMTLLPFLTARAMPGRFTSSTGMAVGHGEPVDRTDRKSIDLRQDVASETF